MNGLIGGIERIVLNYRAAVTPRTEHRSGQKHKLPSDVQAESVKKRFGYCFFSPGERAKPFFRCCDNARVHAQWETDHEAS
jgi:hypothetical protein